MFDLPTIGWAVVVAGGALTLGLAIAYSIMRGLGKTPRERDQAERGAHRIYGREDRDT